MATTPKQSGFLIQSAFGSRGNFELIVPRRVDVAGDLSHYWRNNDAPHFPWQRPINFAASGALRGALIQSNFDTGNLEVVATTSSNQLVHYWRESDVRWFGPSAPFATDVVGNPTLIQSSFGTKGDFEVVVARAGGGLSHYSRDNDAAGYPWRGPTNFGSGHVEGVSLIQSNYGPGNLEVIANVGHQMVYYTRENRPPYTWHGPSAPFGSDIMSNPSLIQGSFGRAREKNFELVVPRISGGLAHFWRDNNAAGTPWRGPGLFGRHLVRMVSLIQSNLGPGNLEVVGVDESNQRLHYWRDNSSPWEWHGPKIF
jgi:hypothetical protein